MLTTKGVESIILRITRELRTRMAEPRGGPEAANPSPAEGFCPHNRFRKEKRLEPHLDSSQIEELLRASSNKKEDSANDQIDANARIHLKDCSHLPGAGSCRR